MINTLPRMTASAEKEHDILARGERDERKKTVTLEIISRVVNPFVLSKSFNCEQKINIYFAIKRPMQWHMIPFGRRELKKKPASSSAIIVQEKHDQIKRALLTHWNISETNTKISLHTDDEIEKRRKKMNEKVKPKKEPATVQRALDDV